MMTHTYWYIHVHAGCSVPLRQYIHVVIHEFVVEIRVGLQPPYVLPLDIHIITADHDALFVGCATTLSETRIDSCSLSNRQVAALA